MAPYALDTVYYNCPLIHHRADLIQHSHTARQNMKVVDDMLCLGYHRVLYISAICPCRCISDVSEVVNQCQLHFLLSQRLYMTGVLTVSIHR